MFGDVFDGSVYDVVIMVDGESLVKMMLVMWEKEWSWWVRRKVYYVMIIVWWVGFENVVGGGVIVSCIYGVWVSFVEGCWKVYIVSMKFGDGDFSYGDV